jgi:dihydroneopterin aldolase
VTLNKNTNKDHDQNRAPDVSGLMGKVTIRGLEVEASVGVFDWEHRVRQPLVFDLELAWDIGRAAKSDQLADTLDYAAVTEYVETLVQTEHYQLLERLLVEVADSLMTHFQVPWLSIRVEKPSVLPQTRAVGISIERGISPWR